MGASVPRLGRGEPEDSRRRVSRARGGPYRPVVTHRTAINPAQKQQDPGRGYPHSRVAEVL